MTIVVLPKTLTEHTTAKATDVMADFNKVLEAINGNLDAENLANGAVGTNELADLAVTSRKFRPAIINGVQGNALGAPGAAQDLPGSEKEVTVAVESYLLVIASFEIDVNLEGLQGTGYIYVNGAEVARAISGKDTRRHTLTCIALTKVAAGTHKVKLRGSGNANFPGAPLEPEIRRSRYFTLALAV